MTGKREYNLRIVNNSSHELAFQIEPEMWIRRLAQGKVWTLSSSDPDEEIQLVVGDSSDEVFASIWFNGKLKIEMDGVIVFDEGVELDRRYGTKGS